MGLEDRGWFLGGTKNSKGTKGNDVIWRGLRYKKGGAGMKGNKVIFGELIQE